MTKEADILIAHHYAMVSERSLVEPFYECAARFFSPIERLWWSGQRSDSSTGPNWNGDLFSGAGIVSLNRFANFLQGNATPASASWMKVQDANLGDHDQEAAQWYADVTRIIAHELRGSATLPGSFYVSKRNEYRSMGISYGVSWVYEQEDDGLLTGKVIYQTVPSYAFYYQLDEFGRMTASSYRREMTHDQMMSVIGKSTFDAENEEMRARNSGDRRTILQIVKRNPKGKPNPRNFDDFLYQEYWVDEHDKEVVRRKGYRSQPFHVIGWHKLPNSHYYVGPAYDALPDMVSAAAARNAQIRAMEWAATPPILGGQKIEGATKTLRPNRITWGAVGKRGDAMLQALNGGQNPAPLFNQVQDDEARVRSLMGNDELLSTQRPNMSATEAAIIAQERASMVAPFAVSVIPPIKGQMARHFEIKARTGGLPDAPDSVRREGEFDVDILGPLSLAARQSETGSMMQMIEQVSFIEQTPSQYLDKPELLTKIVEGHGHLSVLRNFDEVQQEMRQAAAENQQSTDAVIAEQQAMAAKTGAEALQIAGGGGELT